MQKYNTGAVSNTNTMRVARVGVTLMDINTSRPWSVSNSVMGQLAYAGQNGHTMGTTQAVGTISPGSRVIKRGGASRIVNRPAIGRRISRPAR